MDNLIPVFIRPHLLKFLFEQFDGKVTEYASGKTKFVRLYPSSSLSKYLYDQIQYKRQRQKQHEFLIYLHLDDADINKNDGKIYLIRDRVKEPILLSVDKVNSINDFLEDVFRISMVFFVEGCIKFGIKQSDAIDKFIDLYDLLEFGFDPAALRQVFFRNGNKKFKRLQNQSSNRVLNFKNASQTMLQR